MKKIAVYFLSTLLLVSISGCELVKKVPNQTNNNTEKTGQNSITERVEEKKNNPADHIFDIDLKRIQQDFNGKNLGSNELNWDLQAADIITAEFGGGDLHDNKLKSLYHLELKKPETEDRYETGVYIYYAWEDNAWKFEKAEQVYIESLPAEENRLSYERRQELKDAYDNSPKPIEPTEEEMTDEETAPEEETNAEEPTTEEGTVATTNEEVAPEATEEETPAVTGEEEAPAVTDEAEAPAEEAAPEENTEETAQ